MKTHVIVVVALLGVPPVGTALAQTHEPVVATKAAAPKPAAASHEPAVAKKTAAPTSWSFSGTRNAVKTNAGKPAPPSHGAAPAPSHGAPAQAHGPSSAPQPHGAAVRVPVTWTDTARTFVIPRGGIVLTWGSTPTPVHSAAASIQGLGPVSLIWSAAAAPTATGAGLRQPDNPAPTNEGVVAPPVPVAPAIAPPPPAQSRTTAAPPRTERPVNAAPPQATGLDRLSDEWPKAVKVGVQYRGRVEELYGSAATNGHDDEYYLNRIRLEATVNMAAWLKGFAQVQDAQTLGYDIAAQPTNQTNTFDLRQGYLEARWPAANTFGVRVGRQELSFGEQRLVGGADWFNTARSFDAVRVFLTQPGVQVDAFVSSVVVIAQNALDRRKPGETFWGTYVSLSRIVPKGVIEPYVLARFQTSVKGELVGAGDGATYTFGTRGAGALPHRFDYGVEVAAQRGHIATDPITAWAGHYALGWTIVPSAVKPRLVAQFNHASGDGDPRDGRRQTFDQLFPTNHNKYGITDQMGWRNMRDAMVGVELVPVKKLKLNADAHRLFLATTADGLYTAPGTLKVLNRQAASRTVGTELDLQAAYAFSKELSLGGGVGALFAGDYLVQSTRAGTVWTPYLMWNVKF